MQSIAPLFERYLTHFPGERDKLSRLARLIEASATSDELIARTNYTGHVTASGFVVSADYASVLLIHHRRLDMYLQPGGHLERDDASPVEGARREVREETGISPARLVPAFSDGEVPFDIDSHYIPPNPKKGEPEHWHHDFRYVFIAPDEASLALAFDEVAAARWVPIENVRDYPTLADVGAKVSTLVRTLAPLAESVTPPR